MGLPVFCLSFLHGKMCPYPFTGELGRHHWRQPPGKVGECEGDPEEDFAVVRTQVRKVGLEEKGCK